MWNKSWRGHERSLVPKAAFHDAHARTAQSWKRESWKLKEEELKAERENPLITRLEKENTQLKSKIISLEEELEEKNNKIAALEAVIVEKDKEIGELTSTVEGLKEQMVKVAEELNIKKAELEVEIQTELII